MLDRTSFFSQAGGQVPDVGSLVAVGDASFEVTSVQSFGGYVLHIGTLRSGGLACGGELSCEVDYARRLDISKSHTLTHVINLALHQVLGDGVSQKGSLVDESKARFDFSHGKAMTPAECEQVEKLVQENVAGALPVNIETVPLDKALAINNLRAVFGERYPDPVRVVSIGPTVPELLADPASDAWEAYSIELCGGTHIPDTATMATFALVEESAVAKGVRRVVGVTGELATQAMATGAALREQMSAVAAVDVAGADAAALEASRQAMGKIKLEVDAATTSTHLKAQLREQLAAREKLVSKRLKELQAASTDQLASGAVEAAQAAAAAGEQFVVLELGEGLDGKGMQPLVKRVVKESGLPVLALSVAAGKVNCFALVPEASVAQLPANTWLQPVLAEVGGRGGGKPAQAQGSGSEADGLAKAVEVAKAVAGEALGEPAAAA